MRKKILLIVGLILLILIIVAIIAYPIILTKIKKKELTGITPGKLNEKGHQYQDYSQLPTFNVKIVINGRTKSTLDADFAAPDKLQGVFSQEKDGKTEKTNFIQIGDLAYLKKDNKYQLMPRDYLTILKFPMPNEILSSFMSNLNWSYGYLNFQTVLKTKAQLLTYIDDPYGKRLYQSWVVIDKKTQLPYKIQIYDNKKISKTITFSDYGKKVQISAPKEDEIAK